MLDPHEFIKIAKFIVSLIKLPLASSRTNMHDVKDYILLVYITAFILWQLDLKKIKTC